MWACQKNPFLFRTVCLYDAAIVHLSNFVVFLIYRYAFIVAGVREVGGAQVFFFVFKYVISYLVKKAPFFCY